MAPPIPPPIPPPRAAAFDEFGDGVVVAPDAPVEECVARSVAGALVVRGADWGAVLVVAAGASVSLDLAAAEERSRIALVGAVLMRFGAREGVNFARSSTSQVTAISGRIAA